MEYSIEINTALLQQGNYSCVISKDGEQRSFMQRGIADLYDLLHSGSSFLKDSLVADKVVGKGAAALLILGGIKAMHAEVISEAALRLLEKSQIKVDYSLRVPHIINRVQTGPCPLESHLEGEENPEKILQLIKKFIQSMRPEAPKKD